MKNRINHKGFTLMEMLIVVAIVTILVCILLPIGSGAVTAAKEVADVKLLNQAVAKWETLYLDDAACASDVNGVDELIALCDGNYSLHFPDRIPAGGYIAPTTNTTGHLEYIPEEINEGSPYTWELVYASGN